MDGARAAPLTAPLTAAPSATPAVLDLADAALFLCAFVNVLALYLLAPVVKRELTSWMADRREGRLETSGAGR